MKTNGNVQLLDSLVAQAAGQSPTLNVAQPINDVQLLCLMSCQIEQGNMGLEPRDRVALALEVFAEAILQFDNGNGLKRLLQKKARERQILT